jgi:hypothetical protein
VLNLAAMLGQLPGLGPIVTRQVSAENPTGERSQGARAEPDLSDPDLPHSKAAELLGRGFKVRPFVRVDAQQIVTLADIVGAGVITNFFITSNIKNFSDLRLRIYWDDLAVPSVDVDLASFFCLGGEGSSHGVNSLPITVGPTRGCSSSWVMPFGKRARFELENQGDDDAEIVAYKITYQILDEASLGTSRFFARTVAGTPDSSSAEFDLLTAAGEGSVVGVSVNWKAIAPRWWGEGEIKVYFGDDDFPTLVDTGTEDYFGGAWGFGRDATFLPGGPLGETAFGGLFTGAPFIQTNEGYAREIVLYRWHIVDPIGFQDGVRMAVQVIGMGADGHYEIRDDHLTSTGYWYCEPPARSLVAQHAN